MIGRYPDYDVFDAAGTWDAATAKVVNARLHIAGELRFFSAGEAPTARAFCDVCVAQDDEPEGAGGGDGRRETGRRAPRRLPVRRHARRPRHLAAGAWPAWTRWPRAVMGSRLSPPPRSKLRRPSWACWPRASCQAGRGTSSTLKRAWSVCMRMVLAAFYSHPWAWNEIGFGGPAYPRGYMRLGPHQH